MSDELKTTYSVCNSCNTVNRVQTDKISNAPVCSSCKEKLPYHGATLELTGDALSSLLMKSKKPVIIDFWASWCGPCQMYGPVFSQVADELKEEAVFVKINTENEGALSASMGIRGIPATVMFKDGVEVKRQPGAMNPDMLKQFIHS